MNALFSAGILTKVVTEISYARGIVYLDRSGGLALQMHEAIGPSFRLTVPSLESAQLDSALERIVVKFGRQALRVEQTGPATGARIEKLTTEAWECVAEALGVRPWVTRFAVRIFNIWPTPTLDAARAALRASGLTGASQRWLAAWEEPDWASFTANTLTERGLERRCLEEVEHVIDGILPEGFAEFLPAAGVQFDVDHLYRRGGEPFTLDRDEAREFVRSSWNSFQEDRAKVSEVLMLPELQ